MAADIYGNWSTHNVDNNNKSVIFSMRCRDGERKGLKTTDLLTRVQGRKENEWRGELAKLLDISTLRM
jgi:hypothetical protein